jgi:hypothetical protein
MGANKRAARQAARNRKWPACEIMHVRFAGLLEVHLQHFRDLMHETLVGGKGGDLEVQPERAVVEIRRAHRGQPSSISITF